MTCPRRTHSAGSWPVSAGIDLILAGITTVR
jgi:hypothetical protein